MLVVQKGNKQLNIEEIQKDVYLALGYSVIDENGEIEESGQATTLADLQAENATLKEKLTEYKDIKLENKTLKTEIDDLKAQLEAATKKTK